MGGEKKEYQKANFPLYLQCFLGHQNPRRRLSLHYKQFLRVCVGVSLREQEIDIEVWLPKMGAANKEMGKWMRERGEEQGSYTV